MTLEATRDKLIEQINELYQQQATGSKKIAALDSLLMHVSSKLFIEKHGVAEDEIDFSARYRGVSLETASTHLRNRGCDKRFVRWGDRVYHASDFINGKLGDSCDLEHVGE